VNLKEFENTLELQFKNSLISKSYPPIQFTNAMLLPNPITPRSSHVLDDLEDQHPSAPLPLAERKTPLTQTF
jgi:hypothetical protein